MSYDNTNSGALFKNDKKQKDTHPDRTGKLNVDGKDYYLSGWLKQDKNGNPYLSLSVKPVEQRPMSKQATVPSAGKRDGGATQMPDDIPW